MVDDEQPDEEPASDPWKNLLKGFEYPDPLKGVDMSQYGKKLFPNVQFTSPAVEAALGLTEKMHAHQREMDEILKELARPGIEAAELESQRIAREKQTLELTARLVEQQGLMVETQEQLLAEQRRQGTEAQSNRRQQNAVLLVAVLGITATVVTAVGVASKSVFWSVFAAVASTIALGLLALLVMSERTPKE